MGLVFIRLQLGPYCEGTKAPIVDRLRLHDLFNRERESFVVEGHAGEVDAVYEEGDPDFEAKYFDMLAAGGSKHHSELLAPFGLDASDPKFWDKAIETTSIMIIGIIICISMTFVSV